MTRLGTASTALLLALSPVLAPGPSLAAQDVAAYLPVTIQVEPPLEGISLFLDERKLTTDENGLAYARLRRAGSHDLSTPDLQRVAPDVRVQFAHWSDGEFSSTRKLGVTTFTSLEAGFDVSYATEVNFFSRSGESIPSDIVDSLTVLDDRGTGYSLETDGPQWLPGIRIVRRGADLRPQEISFAVDAVVIDGQDRAVSGPARFRPQLGRPWNITLEGSFSASQSLPETSAEEPGSSQQVVFEVRDALLGFATGSAIRVQGPDGDWRRYELGPEGRVTLDQPATGDLRASALGPGISFVRRFNPSRTERVRLSVITYLDLAIGLLTLGLVVAGVTVLVRRIGSGKPRRGALLDHSRPWLEEGKSHQTAAPAPEKREAAHTPRASDRSSSPEAAAEGEAHARAVAMATEAEASLTEARERARAIVSEAEKSLSEARKRAREIVQKGIEEAERQSAELRAQAENALAEAREQAVEIMGEAARDARGLRELAERESAELLRHALRRRNEIQGESLDVTLVEEPSEEVAEEAAAPGRPGVTIKISDASLLEDQVEPARRSTP